MRASRRPVRLILKGCACMDERVWRDRPLKAGETLQIGATTVSLGAPPEQACLVTGDLGHALAAVAPNAPLIGLCEAAPDGAFAIRIARDRALLVLPERLTRKMGWQAEGFALSDASDAYVRLALSGGNPQAILAQMTSAPFMQGSPSAAIRIAGQTGLLLRQGEAYELWVQAAFLTSTTDVLRSVLLL